MDMRVLGELVSTKLRSYVDGELATLRADNDALRVRLAVIEARSAEPGAMGRVGSDGPVGAPGRDGMPGRDGRDGKDGDPGADGLSVDDLDLTYDGERTITLSLKNATTHQVKSIKLPVVLDRGVFHHGQPYERGDVVTYGGSLWIAQKDVTDKPGDGDGWRLSVKRGRDGKDGPAGPQGLPGPPGEAVVVETE